MYEYDACMFDAHTFIACVHDACLYDTRSWYMCI